MRNDLHTQNRWKKVAGDATVTSVLIFALWLSYGCGEDETQVVRSQVSTPVGTAGSTPVRPTSLATSSPVSEPTAPRLVSFEEAEGVYRDGRYDEATDRFLIYSANNPDNAWGHYMTGLSAWKAGVLAQAETSFEHALEIDSSHVKSLINLGRVLLEQGRAQDAKTFIDRALEIDPQSVDGFRVRGRALEDLGDPDAAIESYRQAIVLDPQDSWAMNNLGLVLIREERFDEAVRVLALAVDIRDDVPVFHNNLGIALERTDHGHAAADAYDRALAIEPTYEKAQVNLARVEVRNEGSDVRTVDLSILADEFRREVEEWRKSGETVTDPLGTDLPRDIVH